MLYLIRDSQNNLEAINTENINKVDVINRSDKFKIRFIDNKDRVYIETFDKFESREEAETALTKLVHSITFDSQQRFV